MTAYLNTLLKLIITLPLFFCAVVFCQSTKAQEKSTLGQLQKSELHDLKHKKLEEFCVNVNKKIKLYQWKNIICNPTRWEYERLTVKGNPLVYQTFFNNPKVDNKTLVLCAVHGDEIASAYLCIHLVRDIVYDLPEIHQNTNFIIAPIVNPDSFLSDKPTRTNANGVDLNRNFPTKDWEAKALSTWKNGYRSDPRRFPGDVPGSEEETIFQMELIERFKPSKIISIHGPYGFWDYDMAEHPSPLRWEESKKLAYSAGKKSKNFPVKNFRTFPGSLGNYAGSERNIPTYTLELNGTEAHLGVAFWGRFSESIRSLGDYSFQKEDDSSAMRVSKSQ